LKKAAQSESEADLMRRMRRGDDEALTTWFHLHADGVYGFAFYRVGRNPDLAAEVTQETFARALAKLSDFDAGRGPMIAWLCTLSRNCIRDALRQHGRGALVALWDSVDAGLRRIHEDLDRSPLCPDVIEARETRELVQMTLTNLPQSYRLVLQAKYMDEKSLKRIAEERATTTDAIKGLLKRARRAFKQTFATLADTTPHLEELGGL
jgi:RNA polymerase sigma-70 factor (ECF subfamily)